MDPFKNDRNGSIWQSGISKSLAEYVQRPVCFVKMSSFLFVRACAMPRTLYLSCGFHFQFSRLLSFPIKHQLWSGCHGEKST